MAGFDDLDEPEERKKAVDEILRAFGSLRSAATELKEATARSVASIGWPTTPKVLIGTQWPSWCTVMPWTATWLWSLTGTPHCPLGTSK